MPGERRLWTGPYGRRSRSGRWPTRSTDPSSLWLVPSPLARDQVRRELALRSRPAAGRSARGSGAGPTSGGRSVTRSTDGPGLALRRRGRRGLRRGDPAGAARGRARRRSPRSIDWPGYRRRLRERFAAWTPSRAARCDARRPTSPVAAAEWAVFVRYRDLLRKLGAEDEAGLAVWASQAAARSAPPASLAAFGQVDVPRLGSPDAGRTGGSSSTPSRPRASRSASTLAYEADPALAEALRGHRAGPRSGCSSWGFDETPGPSRDLAARPGCAGCERALFRGRRPTGRSLEHRRAWPSAARRRARASARIAGPRGPRARLDRGADPRRSWSSSAAGTSRPTIALETAAGLGHPGRTPSRARPLGARARGRRAPAGDRPAGRGLGDRARRSGCSATARSARTGRAPTRCRLAGGRLGDPDVAGLPRPRAVPATGLDRADRRAAKDQHGQGRARPAGPGDRVERIFAVLAPARSAPAVGRSGRASSAGVAGDAAASARRMRRRRPRPALGCARRPGRRARAAGPRRVAWSWAGVRRARSSRSRWSRPCRPPPPGPGSVRLATVDAGRRGAGRARHPGRPRRGDVPGPRGGRAVPGAPARRRARREPAGRPSPARCSGSSGSSARPTPGVILVYPDDRREGPGAAPGGVPRRPARAASTPEAPAACHERSAGSTRPDRPARAGRLAGRPRGSARSALASDAGRDRRSSVAAGRATPPIGRCSTGTAAALQVAQQRRLRGTPFGEYDGLLGDGRAVLEIARAFGPELPASAPASSRPTSPARSSSSASTCSSSSRSTSATSSTRTTPSAAAGSTTSSRASRAASSRPRTRPLDGWRGSRDRDRADDAAELADAIGPRPGPVARSSGGRLIRTIGQLRASSSAERTSATASAGPTPHQLRGRLRRGRRREHPVPRARPRRPGRSGSRGRSTASTWSGRAGGTQVPRHRLQERVGAQLDERREARRDAPASALRAWPSSGSSSRDGGTGLLDLGYWGLTEGRLQADRLRGLGAGPGGPAGLRPGRLVDQLRRGVFVVQSRKPTAARASATTAASAGSGRSACAAKRLERSLPDSSCSVQRRRQGTAAAARSRQGGAMSDRPGATRG